MSIAAVSTENKSLRPSKQEPVLNGSTLRGVPAALQSLRLCFRVFLPGLERPLLWENCFSVWLRSSVEMAAVQRGEGKERKERNECLMDGISRESTEKLKFP